MACRVANCAVVQVLCDIDGAVVDKLLEPKAGSGLGGAVWRDGGQMFRGNGHDTTLLMMRHAWLTFVYLLDAGKERKSLFESPWFSPKGGMSIGVMLWGVWITGHLSEFR